MHSSLKFQVVEKASSLITCVIGSDLFCVSIEYAQTMILSNKAEMKISMKR